MCTIPDLFALDAVSRRESSRVEHLTGFWRPTPVAGAGRDRPHSGAQRTRAASSGLSPFAPATSRSSCCPGFRRRRPKSRCVSGLIPPSINTSKSVAGTRSDAVAQHAHGRHGPDERRGPVGPRQHMIRGDHWRRRWQAWPVARALDLEQQGRHLPGPVQHLESSHASNDPRGTLAEETTHAVGRPIWVTFG
jgi:hypothetical protein